MKKDCQNYKKNLDYCNCSYPGCSRKGVCCECLHYHRQNNQLPACFFPDEIEKTYDRSFTQWIKVTKGNERTKEPRN